MKDNVSKVSCKRGFTLIELLVVVLIIGILAAVALPQYQIAVAKSRYAGLKTLVHQLVEAEGVYYLTNSTFTTNLSELDVEIPQSATVTCLFHTNGDAVTCDDTKISLRYGVDVFYSPATSRLDGYARYAGRAHCMPLTRDKLPHKICQLETGKNVPEIYGAAYWYPKP